MLSLPPSQGTSCCFTWRIISLLLFQHRGQMALVLWEPWTLVLRTGINPFPGGEGAWLLLKVRRKLVMSPMSWGSALGKGLLFFQGGRHYMMTHDDRFCCCCALCGAGPSKGSQRCLPKHLGTLGTHRDRSLAGLQQERVATFKASTNTKMGLRPKRRMNFVFWGSSACLEVRLLKWAPKNQGARYI